MQNKELSNFTLQRCPCVNEKFWWFCFFWIAVVAENPRY